MIPKMEKCQPKNILLGNDNALDGLGTLNEKVIWTSPKMDRPKQKKYGEKCATVHSFYK